MLPIEIRTSSRPKRRTVGKLKRGNEHPEFAFWAAEINLPPPLLSRRSVFIEIRWGGVVLYIRASLHGSDTRVFRDTPAQSLKTKSIGTRSGWLGIKSRKSRRYIRECIERCLSRKGRCIPGKCNPRPKRGRGKYSPRLFREFSPGKFIAQGGWIHAGCHLVWLPYVCYRLPVARGQRSSRTRVEYTASETLAAMKRRSRCRDLDSSIKKKKTWFDLLACPPGEFFSRCLRYDVVSSLRSLENAWSFSQMSHDGLHAFSAKFRTRC